MSLVDYASSSEEEEIGEDEGDKEEDSKRDESAAPSSPPPLPPQPPTLTPNPQSQNFIASSHQRSGGSSPLPPPSIEGLPDASLLLSSPSLPSHQVIDSDHASRVAAAMAESASRKRESNGSTIPYARSKHPRGHLPYSRNVPDTTGGLLIPPQLSGRSNVVTEDISRLFVGRNSEIPR